MTGARYTPLGKAVLDEWRRSHSVDPESIGETDQAPPARDVKWGGTSMTAARYIPLGKAVGILETCIVRRTAPDNPYMMCQPKRGRFLVWCPGEDDLSTLVWFSFTEIEKAQKAEEAE